jgi:hypothetical protein
MKDPRELPDHIENLEERPIDPDRVISDEQLRIGGLAPVRAYVRTRAGKSAERQQRYRQNKEAQGFKQTNVQVPEDQQATIREIARKMREGEDTGAALSDFDRKVLGVARAEGLRSRLLRLIVGV